MNEDQDWYNQPAQEIAVAKNMVDVQLEMAKMRRTEICEEIEMKRNQLTLLDAQLEEENREPDHMRPIRRFSKLTIGRGLKRC